MRPKVERPGNEMAGQGFHESFGESRKYVNGAVFGYWRRRIVWHMFSIWHGPCFSYEYAFFKAAASESASGEPL